MSMSVQKSQVTQDGKIHKDTTGLRLVDDLKMFKITMSNTSSRNKLNPEINDHYNIFTRESQEYELKTKDEAYGILVQQFVMVQLTSSWTVSSKVSEMPKIRSPGEGLEPTEEMMELVGRAYVVVENPLQNPECGHEIRLVANTDLEVFDLIIGMDWLAYHRAAKSDCYEKDCRFLFRMAWILEVQGFEKPGKKTLGITCIVDLPYRLAPSENVRIIETSLKNFKRRVLFNQVTHHGENPVSLCQEEDGSNGGDGALECVLTTGNPIKVWTIKNRLPFSPELMTCLDQLQGACYFSQIDLRSDHHQLSVREEDITIDRLLILRYSVHPGADKMYYDMRGDCIGGPMYEERHCLSTVSKQRGGICRSPVFDMDEVGKSSACWTEDCARTTEKIVLKSRKD
ncbi:hypothetical protein Tco_0598755 [Tanacetum coccineum]